MTHPFSTTPAGLDTKHVVLEETGESVQLLNVHGQVGYSTRIDHRAAWVWLTADDIIALRPYDGPRIKFNIQPDFVLPKKAKATGS